MGPENSPLTHLCYINLETGERLEIDAGLVEVSLTETEMEGDWTVSNSTCCRYCAHADCERTQDTKIRCKRWSRWVEPTAPPCEEYGYSIPFKFDPVQYAETMKYFQNQGGKYKI